MPDSTTAPSPKMPRRRRAKAPPPAPTASAPTAARNMADPGDSTQRNYRYQHMYGVVLLVAAKRALRPYSAIWCEQHEDLLCERTDGRFDAYQIKTSHPELGAWLIMDQELVSSIGRFVDLVSAFGEKVNTVFFVSNTALAEVSATLTDQRRRGRCPRLFVEHIRSCRTPSEVAAPFREFFDGLQSTCGCAPDLLFRVLRRMDFITGPSRTEFDAVLSHEHLAALSDCASLSPSDLDIFRDSLVSVVYRASSLQVTDPIRHLRSLFDGQLRDPALLAKKLCVEDVVVYHARAPVPPNFTFPGIPVLDLTAVRPVDVLPKKLQHGGLQTEIDYFRDLERGAEYSLLEDVGRRPDAYPALLRQLEQYVAMECSEAYLKARQNVAPYGPTMLLDVQNRLKSIAATKASALGYHPYECLMGIAALLTSDCRVWWSERFDLGGPP
jgi:hypothetical protein